MFFFLFRVLFIKCKHANRRVKVQVNVKQKAHKFQYELCIIF